jgi:ElaB/YqjD/DUF883 family membrane-anchored ribosome-binding protein
MSEHPNGMVPPAPLPHQGVERLAQGAHQAVDRLAGTAGQIADALAANREELQGLPARVGDTCRAPVRDHPLASLGLAVAAGFALSWLMRAR